ncbi:uncharacterized protein LOC118258350 isoform X2 [Cygnus atratus]|uniref:uncharacterized protein LOC118258350 isoform X2 n=1 Tax=Cygnus atratus TaxID=8868 RepID=UPI0021B73474|nr:uncharacterized protein LOC118258350 isoform X2 [Cygnus atratus]
MLPGARGDAEVPGPDQEGAVPQGRASHGEEKPGLPLRRKLCYAIGGIPYQMTANALGFFLQIFLLDVVQLEPFHASLILFLGRAWDAVTDPAVGFLVSKSPRRKYGKLIPWIACSTPFGVLCYCMMWSTLADGAPVSLKFLWYLFTYNFFQICMTCYHVPYSSLTMFLGGNQRDRDSATAYRMGMEVFSTLLGSGIQGQMVGAYHGHTTNGCSFGNGTLPNSSTPSLAGSLEGTSLRVCLPGPGLDLLPLLSDSCLRGQGAAGAPQPPGEDWAALHELPEDDRGTQALHPSALWLPLRVPGLPGHAGDFCFLLYSRRGAGREVSALGAHHAGHSFPLYPLLAVVFGEIWEENGSDLGPGADHPGPGGHHPGEPQLPGLRPPDGGGRLQLGRALPPALFCRLPRQRLHLQPLRHPCPEASHGPSPDHPAAHRHNHLLPPSHQRGAEEADEDGAGGDGASGAARQLRPPPGLSRCEGCFLRVPESMVGCWSVLPSATTLLSASLPADLRTSKSL